MRVALLTEGTRPYAHRGGPGWCARLVEGLGEHEFELFVLARRAGRPDGPDERPDRPGRTAAVHELPMWGCARPGADRARCAAGSTSRRTSNWSGPW